MPRVPRWALLSSSCAPVLLIGGWTLAAARQPSSYDAVRDTISALAAHGATDRWLMTGALAGLGVCHVVTAFGLRPARRTGRLVLAGGGAATVLVAVFPLRADGDSVPHTAAAAAAFGALAVWPAFAGLAVWPAFAGYAARVPWGLRPRVSRTAAVVLLGAVGWFVVELVTDSDRVGLAERVAAGAQAVWPLAVVLSARAVRADRKTVTRG